MIAFDHPWVLYLAPVVAVAITALAWWCRRTRVTRARQWSREIAAVAMATGRWGAVALGVAAFSVTVGLAGPRFGQRTVTTEAKSLDLIVAVDISRSMLAEDVQPSRLERAQQEVARLMQDLAGDRIGLIAFAGQSFILSPLTVDQGALRLLVDGLHPDMASAGGTALGPALRQARQLLTAGEGVADRVLVVFTDGEALDSMPGVLDAARQTRRDGIRVVLVAEGGRAPTTIPVRDPDGVLIGYQRDENNALIETERRDDILSDVADAAQGVVVSAELPDQAGAVRELIAGFKRAPLATSTAAQDVPRAWIPSLVAVTLLLFQTFTRRTAALAVLALLMAVSQRAEAQGVRNPADDAWRAGDFAMAAELYRQQVRAGFGGDTAWLNLGTAALALDDSATARAALGRAAESLDPELRFRALYNLGLMDLRLARRDSLNRDGYLDAARDRYREALLLKPGHPDAKWNYELALRESPPQSGGGGQQPQSQGSGGSSNAPPPDPSGGLTREQAEQILNSMLEEERATRDAVNRRNARARTRVGSKE